MKFGKRQLMVGAMVVALGAAVYLNWQFSGTQPASVTETASENTKQLGQTVYVNTELSEEVPVLATGTEASTEAVETAAAGNSLQEYFAGERRKRKEAREDALEALTEITEAADSSDSARQEAVAAAQAMAAAIKAESDMESEIKAKGVRDCLVSINQGACSVIVPAEGLNDALAITIKDIVHRQAAIDFEQITITPVNPE